MLTAITRLVFLAAMVLAQSASSKPIVDPELSQLAGWMTGSFSSAEQAAADSNFFDIRLEMVPIWTDRDDAIWLYVEQAASWSLDKPYRQRVYRVTRHDEETISSAVYTFKDPLRFAGGYKLDVPLGSLSPDSLSEREGCAIFLKREGKHYSGSTVEQDCGSTLRGASYATSEVSVMPELLSSWDRGYDEEGEQVWGAITGPYLFKRVTAEK